MTFDSKLLILTAFCTLLITGCVQPLNSSKSIPVITGDNTSEVQENITTKETISEIKVESLTLTPSFATGPYFSTNSPERTSLLEPNTNGTRLNLTGQVLTKTGKPIEGAKLDFWQTNSEGIYDNVGFNFRGHQFTDSKGGYVLETIVPGLYGTRFQHIHVKLTTLTGHTLTTQIIFPGQRFDPGLAPELYLSITETDEGKQATFDFVLDLE